MVRLGQGIFGSALKVLQLESPLRGFGLDCQRGSKTREEKVEEGVWGHLSVWDWERIGALGWGVPLPCSLLLGGELGQ